MAPRSPRENFGVVPEDRRCTATVTGHQKGAPYPCPRWAMNGMDVCSVHRPDRYIPSHDPPPGRRCCSKSMNVETRHYTEPCKLWAMRGQTTCYRHGGANRIKRAAGDRRMAEDKVEKKARALTSLFTSEPVDNPLTALAEHIGEEILFKDILATFVKDLDARDIRYTDARGSEQLRSEIVVYERALGRVGDRLVAYAKLGIDERLVKIEEDKAAVVMGAINAVIEFLGATGAEAAEARRIASGQLRAVS